MLKPSAMLLNNFVNCKKTNIILKNYLNNAL